MILTFTPDPVLDSILLIDEFTQGIPMTAGDHRLSVGGKGMDSSVALSHLGVHTRAFCFLAGRTGKELLGLIADQYGFPVTTKWVEGETRSAYIVSEIKNHTHSHIFAGGISLTAEDENGLLDEFCAYLSKANYVILGGVFPKSTSPNIYEKFISKAHQLKIPTLVDAHTEYMRSALPSQPTIVKQNWHEFNKTFGQETSSLVKLINAGKRIYEERSLQNLVITCGQEGMLAFTSQGCFHAQPPQLKAVNAAGAGDTASAAIAWKQTEKQTWPETVRWAAAASAAAVLTEGTADLHIEDVHKILPQVSVSEV